MHNRAIYLKENYPIKKYERKNPGDIPKRGVVRLQLHLPGGDGPFSFPVEWRYHADILESEGYPVGREVEYDDDIDPPTI